MIYLKSGWLDHNFDLNKDVKFISQKKEIILYDLEFTRINNKVKNPSLLGINQQRVFSVLTKVTCIHIVYEIIYIT